MCWKGNVFINQERGPQALKVTSPANTDFGAVPELDDQPDSRELCRKARAAGAFVPREGNAVAIAGPSEIRYQIDPDRDLNGARLVYFSNFISILDRAERDFLEAATSPLPQTIIDERSTGHRQIAYFANAKNRETLFASHQVWASHWGPPEKPRVKLVIQSALRRSSDNAMVVMSSVTKYSPLRDDGAQEWGRTLPTFGAAP